MNSVNEVTISIILAGGLAILIYVIYSFWYGRQTREPLIRDEKVEENACSLVPTSTIENDVVDRVSIVDNDFANELKTIPSEELVNDTTDENQENMQINYENDPQKEEGNTVKKGLWSRLKEFFSDRAIERNADKHEPTVMNNEIADPEQSYQIRLMCEDNDLYAARDVVELCKKFNFEMCQGDIFCFKQDGQVVFKLGSNQKPYGFNESYVDTTTYKSLVLVMTLPDRGFAENFYVLMASCAFKFQQNLGGIIRDANNNPLDEKHVLETRKILNHYDKMLS
jgi:FtsZ-interacting cell division protein ZipA